MKLPGGHALQSRDYRLYWLGYVTEVSGQQMLWVAQGWLIYELSGSAWLLGVAGLARALPATILTFVGGALADKMDQRRLLIAVQAIQMTLLTTLATITLLGQIEVWHLLVIVSASAAAQSFENPARQAIFPRLIRADALMDAVALNSTVHPGARLFGPFVGGLLMAQIRLLTDEPLLGAAVLFYLTAFGYVVNARFLHVIRLPSVEAKQRSGSVLSDMAMGVRYIFKTPIFGFLIAMTYCSQFFGWSFQSLFPIFAKDVFNGGEFELGLMYSALGGGSLLGAVTAANLADLKRRGWLIIGGFMVQAGVIVLVSVVPYFWLMIPILISVGASQSLFSVLSQSTLHHLVPNEFRGRVMGIWGMTHTAVQPLGQLQMGALAGVLSAPIAVVIGSVAMLSFGLLVVLPSRRVRSLTLPLDAREVAQVDEAEEVGQR